MKGPAAGQVQPLPVYLWDHLVRVIKQFTDGCFPCWAYRCLEGPSQKPSPAATGVGLGAAQQEVLRPDAASLGFVTLREILGKFTEEARTAHLCGINHWKRLGWAHKLEEVESQGIPQAELPVLSRSMVTQT